MISIRKNIRKMTPYRPPLSNRGSYLRLDFNENVLGPSPAVLDCLRSFDLSAVAVYPDDSQATEAVAEYYSLPPDSIVLTNGADEGIQCMVNLLVEPGDVIPLFEPTYAMFRVYLEIAGAHIESVLYNDDLEFPVDALRLALEKQPKLVFICSPNNPTGTQIDADCLLQLVQEFPATAFAVDEAYADFTSQTVLPDSRSLDNLFVLRTFSKAFGLATLRLGVVCGTPENIRYLRKVRSPYSICGLSLQLLCAALQDTDYVKTYVADVLKNKQFVLQWLDNRKITFHAGKANFILVHVGDRIKEITEGLLQNGILVRSRDKDPLLKGYFRLTVGTEKAMRKFLEVFSELL